MSKKNVKTQKHEDYITSAPEPIKFMTMEEMYVARDFFYILRVLTATPKTAKEIFEDIKEKGLKSKLKTIYRHLEKLHDAGLVMIAGHRSRKGRGSPEKLYQRTARIFYVGPKEKIAGTKMEESGKKGAEIAATFLKGLYQKEVKDEPAFSEAIWQFMQSQIQVVWELVENAKTNKNLEKTIYELDIATLGFLLDLTTSIASLLRHPELIEKFNRFLN
ncbi:MAG: hypothetical protein ACE5OZ_13595 [Candidatus Heimdallarchaeota archaeon]